MSVRFGRLFLVGVLSLVATACGKKGPLIYPDMLVPAAPTAVSAMQSGVVVKLQFALSDKDRSGRPVQALAGVKISRRVADMAQKDVCRSCMADYMLFQTLYLDHLPTTTQCFGNRLILLDSDVKAGNSYSYSIVPFTSDGVAGASSPIVDAGVVKPFPAPALKIEPLTTEVKLHILSKPLTSGRLIGYNLYRTPVASVRSFQPLNREPIKGNEYVDAVLERGVKYRYAASALIMTTSGGVAESAESQEVEGMLKDDE